MSEQVSACLQGVNIYDDKLVNKTGLGCGCDITQSIGLGNCKTQILDYELLKNVGGVELDPSQALYKISRTGSDYTKMTKEINTTLAGKLGFDFLGMAFGWNLENSISVKTNQLDIYEYGTTMIVNKMYSLNIKPVLYDHLKDFIGLLTWNEINATDETDRTDKKKMKELFKKYGTHISTKAFYGSLYQYILYREQNEWESEIEAQLQIGTNSKIPIPETGMTVNGGYDTAISDKDQECYKHSYKVETERKIGGNTNIEDLNEWLASCSPENPNSCALLGYSFGVNGDNDSGLIPLYELFDNDDLRKNAMKEAMDEYIQENGIALKTSKMVLLDAFGKHYSNGNAPEYQYQERNGKTLKYFRLDENIFKHVRGCTKGCFHFYYALGHLLDEAIVDMKFDDSGDLDGDWHTRGDHANAGVTGDVRNRYLCVKYEHPNNTSENDFVTGFGVKVDKTVKSISKGTTTNFNWTQNGDNWYKGLVHDDVYCIYTKDKLKDF